MSLTKSSVENSAVIELSTLNRVVDPEAKKRIETLLGDDKLQDFRQKAVLVAQSGNGDEAFWLAQSNPKALVAVDSDLTNVELTRKKLRRFGNVLVQQSEFAKGGEELGQFDRVVVLEPLALTSFAAKTLWKKVRPGGKLYVITQPRFSVHVDSFFVAIFREVVGRLPLGILICERFFGPAGRKTRTLSDDKLLFSDADSLKSHRYREPYHSVVLTKNPYQT